MPAMLATIVVRRTGFKISEGEPGSERKRKAGSEQVASFLRRRSFRIVLSTIPTEHRQSSWECGYVCYKGGDAFTVPAFRIKNPDEMVTRTWIATLQVTCDEQGSLTHIRCSRSSQALCVCVSRLSVSVMIL